MTRDFAHEHNTKHRKAPRPVLEQALYWVGALGWLAGIGALAIPGLGPFIAAGPIMAAFGRRCGRRYVGGLTGALVGMGMPEFEAKKYEGKVKSGSSLISVHSEDSKEVKRAKEICERAGAQDITTAGEVAVASGKRA